MSQIRSFTIGTHCTVAQTACQASRGPASHSGGPKEGLLSQLSGGVLPGDRRLQLAAVQEGRPARHTGGFAPRIKFVFVTPGLTRKPAWQPISRINSPHWSPGASFTVVQENGCRKRLLPGKQLLSNLGGPLMLIGSHGLSARQRLRPTRPQVALSSQWTTPG